MHDFPQYDVIISGGGMVGLAMATALAQQNTALQIALLDAAPLVKPADHRLIALNYNSFCLLQNLDAWQHLAEQAAPINTLHVSQHGHFGVTRIQHTDCNLPALGYVLPAAAIEEALFTALTQQHNITLYKPATLNNFSTDADIMTVALQHNGVAMSLKTRILIGADGTHSILRQLAGLATDTMDYQQTALVTVTELQRSHAHTAYERFHGNGAIAMLPLLGNRVATIWTEDNAVIQRLLALSNVDFCQTLQNEFGYRLGRLVSCGARYSYPLQRQTTLQNYTRPLILIGNAAHTLHPVAAQGLNFALAEVAMLTETLVENIQMPNWESYREWQQQQMNSSLRLSHDLLQLFSHDLTPVAWARQTGMVALDICPPLKRRFAARAQGRDRPLPPLLRTKVLE